MDKKQIRQKIEDGWILARVILELVGKPKKHVDKTLKDYIKTMKSENIKVIKTDLGKAKKHEGTLFAAFAEIEIMFKDLNNLVYFCFDYMPSSIEIEEPEELVYDARKLTGFVNDMQGRLHDVDLAAKQLKQQNIKLNLNFSKLLKNFIANMCIGGKTVEQLEKITGMPKKHVEKVLQVLVKEKRIKKEGQSFITIK